MDISRRDFLAKMGLGAATVALGPSLFGGLGGGGWAAGPVMEGAVEEAERPEADFSMAVTVNGRRLWLPVIGAQA